MRIILLIAVLIVVALAVFFVIFAKNEAAPSTGGTMPTPASGQETKKPSDISGVGGVREKTPAEACQALCEERLSEGADLSNGPCLSNEIAPGWVCDVAHSPRAAVDNDRANQCPEFGKTAFHFVEVSPACDLIKEY